MISIRGDGTPLPIPADQQPAETRTKRVQLRKMVSQIRYQMIGQLGALLTEIEQVPYRRCSEKSSIVPAFRHRTWGRADIGIEPLPPHPVAVLPR